MTLSNSDSYVRFLKTLAVQQSKNPCKDLDATELNLLHYVVLASAESEHVLVGDLLGLTQYASQATLHAKMKQLIAKGFLTVESNNDDGRKKYIVPSKTASKYVGFMSDCLTKATK
jgi:DNA-binding MarR family transcriptional regulator